MAGNEQQQVTRNLVVQFSGVSWDDAAEEKANHRRPRSPRERSQPLYQPWDHPRDVRASSGSLEEDLEPGEIPP